MAPARGRHAGWSPAGVRLDAREAEAGQRRVAGGLRARGLGPGDRVLVSLAPTPDVVVLVLGATRSGVVPVMVNPDLLPHERAVVEADAEAALVIDHPRVAAALLDGPPEAVADAPLVRPMHLTSGTTGRPKGVWFGAPDERAGAAWVEEETTLWGFADDDLHLVCGPLHHSAPLRFAAMTLLAGGDVIVPPSFSTATFAAALAEGVTTTFVVPAHLQRLLGPGGGGGEGFDGSSLRLLAHAGAPCPEPLKRLAIDTFGPSVLWEFYGATEGQCTACDTPTWLERPGTVGRARPGRSLAVDDDGAVWCRVPPHARFEYWRDEAATAAAWRGDAFTVGDAGHLDADGHLFLEGRRGEIIITGGVNVAPLEVERALGTCPGVQDVAVFGLEDERWGERVCAAVVGVATAAQVVAHAATTLAPHKRPKQVLVVPAIPRNANGKVRRDTLAADLGLSS